MARLLLAIHGFNFRFCSLTLILPIGILRDPARGERRAEQRSPQAFEICVRFAWPAGHWCSALVSIATPNMGSMVARCHLLGLPTQNAQDAFDRMR